MRFSERYGHKTVREAIQTDSIDEALKNKVWSLLKMFYWDKAQYSSHGFGGGYSLLSQSNSDLNVLCERLCLTTSKYRSIASLTIGVKC
jgi:hypothetical protein